MSPTCAPAPFDASAALSCDTRWRAHDLLRLRRLPQPEGEPEWVRYAFARAPFAVVRRAPAAFGVVAVGMRGANRAQRYATWAEADDIVEIISPEDFAASWPAAIGRRALPAFATLDVLRREALTLRGFAWGPTGSAGFELATQVPTVSVTSDLDLLIRTPNHLSRDEATQLFTELQAHALRAGSRVDVQLETPAGGVALAEWASGRARVMARHAQGPRLLADPWATQAGQT
ncbi:malonate decarboxylase holo-ACP synthase [Paraburkholderia sp. DHOC27]|uniref:malonate decarboxylase holo-ACP synthase n=1 Tax=Paraburkholderia sp. DHOC27 TaxID=2303330 RepID=UPI000E3B8051|nr:malonate decarboxylase holo-ACP synthase [Paraburkholderia sp. DHOC27]RFU44164.1 malonate decarboxylase holo-ACP synthase [Paraburkholderia sp. DHOC27]